MPEIKIFAVDHKRRKEWKLPYIRLGTKYDHNSGIADCTDENILRWTPDFSEGTAYWWVNHHLDDFGNPDYIGMCHYRRFFTVKADRWIPMYETVAHDEGRKIAMTPNEQMLYLIQNGADGITHVKFDSAKPDAYSNVIEMMLEHSVREKDFKFEPEYLQMAFDCLKNALPEKYLRAYEKVFVQKGMYHCNQLTLKRQYFSELCEIIFKAFDQIFSRTDAGQMNNMRSHAVGGRWAGYIFEMFVSTVLSIFEETGAKFMKLPLVVLCGDEYS